MLRMRGRFHDNKFRSVFKCRERNGENGDIKFVSSWMHEHAVGEAYSGMGSETNHMCGYQYFNSLGILTRVHQKTDTANTGFEGSRAKIFCKEERKKILECPTVELAYRDAI
ncbi:hypothetical protein ElyMa_005523400 [Elysia marginata]|uniref:Uncharacterized protein n=1 Tax=Elysia marginata TaxID=1093978 RepID=A0AAV4EXY9_9GAST|nr:hypothetical protein ElyMa_005523400 [Elysia marginata]